MSIPEFCQLNRGEITLKQIHLNRRAERTLNKLCNKNEMLANFMVFAFATTLLVSTNVYAGEVSADKINELGRKLLTLVQDIGYWFCILMAGKEIIVNLLEGQTKDVIGVIIKYVMAFAGFYTLPWAFDMIKSLLG